MAHPKRKQSKTRTAKRRTHDKAVAPTLAVCPNCGAPIAAGSKFCTSCGVAVDEQNVKPQDDSTQE